MKTLNICHLYGNLMNTYSDIGNILVMEYYAKKINVKFNIETISLYQDFDPDKYDFVLFGGAQDFEQAIVSKDLPSKRKSLAKYIENDGVLLAICGGFQLLGQYYVDASGNKIPGANILQHYTKAPQSNEERFIGDIKIHNELFNEDYIGFENHGGRTYLASNEQPLGKVLKGHGNNGSDNGEGVIYKNTYGSYFHGPILPRNPKLAIHLLNLALKNRFGNEAPQASLDLIDS